VRASAASSSGRGAAPAPRPRRLAAATLVALAALCGCASVSPTGAPPAGGRLDAPREWNGRFSVRVAGGSEGRQDAAIGRFALVERPTPAGRALELGLVSPFGQTIADARREPDGRATLRTADGRVLAAGSLDALLRQATGFPLPVERLPDWLDDRFQQVDARDASGAVVSARDSGWRIEREPSRWSLARPGPEGELRVVLILDR
jgi:outer membrane biogenesis lipoprotein LolB